MRSVLADRLDSRVNLVWGKKVTGLREDFTLCGHSTAVLEFENSPSFEADYVVGTDGISSTIRELLFPYNTEVSKATKTGYTFALARVKTQDSTLVQAVLDRTPLAQLLFYKGSVGGYGGEFKHPCRSRLLTLGTSWDYHTDGGNLH